MNRDDFWLSPELATFHDPVRFLLVGQKNCGTGLVRDAISVHPDAVCYGELLHEDETKRREYHESHFGQLPDEGVPGWFVEGVTNAERYLSTEVFDHPLRDQLVYGLQIAYGDVTKWDLWDYLREKCLAGDFCVIHVFRAPLPCFAASKAEEIAEHRGDTGWEVKDVELFAQKHESEMRRVRGVCADAIEIDFQELSDSGTAVIEKLFGFLELPTISRKVIQSSVSRSLKEMRNSSFRRILSSVRSMRGGMPVWMEEYFQ